MITLSILIILSLIYFFQLAILVVEYATCDVGVISKATAIQLIIPFGWVYGLLKWIKGLE